MNSTPDLISVIVTNYNHAKYLDQRMESVLKQTYPNLEIIVIDNCSTDNSLEVLAKYKQDSKVKIVALDKNGGFVSSSNLGPSLSHGKFFMYAEADDFNDSSHIERLHQGMAGNENIGVGFCRSLLVDAKGKAFGDDFKYRERVFKELCSNDAFIPRHLVRRFFLYACIIPNFSAALIRRKYFDLSGGILNQYKTCPDWEFWFRIARHCDFYYVASPLNNFRKHGTSAQTYLGVQSMIIDIMGMLYTELRKEGLPYWQQFRYRVNIGVIWGSFGINALGIWWKSFPAVWRESLKYDKLSIVYLILGFIKRLVGRLFRRG